MGVDKVVAAPVGQRYYTPMEVTAHSAPDDMWVSFHYKVFDLTALVKEHQGPLVEPLLKAAGTDITHWFAPLGDDGKVKVKTHNDPVTNLEVPYCPYGHFVHVPPREPTVDWDNSFGLPWWQDDERYFVGLLSQKTRVIRVKNVLTGQEDGMEVPCEETVQEIQHRYLELNWHANSYTWKVLKPYGGEWIFAPLDMSLTLSDNGVPDEDYDFEVHEVDDNYYIPVIFLYYNDDLSVK